MQFRSALAGPTYVLIAVATLMLQLALFDRQGLVAHEWAQLAMVLGLGLMIQQSDRWANRRAGKTAASMGFLSRFGRRNNSPAQLVQTAERQGVEVRPVDVNYSAWECTLEAGSVAGPALRLGFRMVKGLSRQAGERIATARGGRPRA